MNIGFSESEPFKSQSFSKFSFPPVAITLRSTGLTRILHMFCPTFSDLTHSPDWVQTLTIPDSTHETTAEFLSDTKFMLELITIFHRILRWKIKTTKASFPRRNRKSRFDGTGFSIDQIQLSIEKSTENLFTRKATLKEAIFLKAKKPHFLLRRSSKGNPLFDQHQAIRVDLNLWIQHY